MLEEVWAFTANPAADTDIDIGEPDFADGHEEDGNMSSESESSDEDEASDEEEFDGEDEDGLGLEDGEEEEGDELEDDYDDP